MKGGIPASESVANNIAVKVSGIYLLNPPASVMYLDSIACKTPPAAKKSDPLNIAWLIRWLKVARRPVKNSCIKPAAPAPRNMYPNCDAVEKARTSLISRVTVACVAMKKAVNAPILAMVTKKKL